MPKLVIAATLVLIPLAIAVTITGKPDFHATAYEPPQPAPLFTLTTHEGAAVTMSDFENEPALVFFGFTHCPDVCPLTLSTLSRVAGDTKILLITVDPERDTPAALAEYIDNFDANITGLTGDPRELARLRSAYGVHAGPGTATHGMTHTAAVFGIDDEGQIRVVLRPDQPEDELAEDIQTLRRL